MVEDHCFRLRDRRPALRHPARSLSLNSRVGRGRPAGFTACLVLIWGVLTATAASTAAEAAEPSIAGCSIYSSSNIWNARIESLTVHPRSNDYVQTIGPNLPLHPDFGSGVWPPGSDSPMGIPFVTVPGSQAEVPVSFTYSDESDPGPYPIPPDAPIEGGANSTGDRHVLVLETGSCTLYELYNAFPQGGGTSWRADSGAVFDLASDLLRPAGWTSADAAGLPILPGLVRFDEVAAGAIHHAIRFTAPQTQRAYVWPARHYASSLTSPVYPPMGIRFRLRSDFDLSGFDPQARVILRALQEYGMILADNGSSWYISGAPDPRWDNEVLAELKQVKGSDFEAVDVSPLMVDPDSGSVRQPTPLVFPQFVLGSGFSVVLMLVNTGAETWNGSAILNGGSWPQGSRWWLNGAERTGASSFEISLSPGASGRYLLEGDSGLVTGGLAIEGLGTSPGTALASAFFFQYWDNGTLVDSTGVPPTPAARAVRFPVERGERTSTGIAIRQIGDPVQFQLYDAEGNLVEQQLVSGEGARFCEEIFDQMPALFVGSVAVASSSDFYLVVLRQEIVGTDPLQFQLTSIPATPLP